MITALDYRQFARECTQGARSATSNEIRKQFLELAKLWMTAAERLESGSAPLPKIIKANGHRPPEVA
jgi:hypothetical protein